MIIITHDQEKNYTLENETCKSPKDSKQYVPLFKLDTPKD